ncbi:bacterial cell division membrane protein [Prevotella dentalis DSM 3688]|uniref:Probable peptidoglycan glycosyltransferase FtsW n=1 Tax=Prevotella dentalis (strain ATCC 49559 / DSM 3688 / JCM 13448 / NCTC 12043 / ES 2772) TaxID=908937 RepID=F9D3R1_PREDD|nr:FtsW/RodA/SpoVE family cell cycle protein [Prevotella dentalis]AGB27498.1 bacterial cell division membrane protein [Prevotella dentalis DSM 3688]EGQ14346.1 rod shape-determining protein RodA [Prevotella dentalis DSM 3688]
MNKRLGNIFKGDKVIWMVFFFLCLISIVEVFSASSELTYKGGNYLAPIIKHILILGVGILLMVVTLNIKCRYFKIGTFPLLLISFLTLIWVYFAGQSTNDAQRWISILGIQFQPSEFAKGAMVLATAQILSAMQTDTGADRHAMPYILSVGVFIIPLIGAENLSTAALLCVVLFFMMVIGRVPGQQLGKLIGAVVLLITGVVTLVMVLGTDIKELSPENNLTEQVAQTSGQSEGKRSSGVLHRFDTWKSRIDKFLDSKEVPPEDVDLDKDGQVAHANIAIATSNVIGKGPGNSVERDFLSQAFSDFIYAIIIEETGIVGAAFVAMLYIILLFRTSRIASRCENNFPAFLAMGLALLLVTQALFNMCVAVGLAPVTGQPLPLVSKGGTSSVINCVYIGAILSVSRSAKRAATIRNESPKPLAAEA